MATFVEKIEQLRKTMLEMNANKIFLINEKNAMDYYSINFLYPGGTITFCDTRGPFIKFKTNKVDKLIDEYLKLIKNYHD